MGRPVLEVADIFRDPGPTWHKANAGHVSLEQLKVMSAIESCRTAALGGHVARCEDCAHEVIAYNSCLMGRSSNGELACRHRHFSRLSLPKCLAVLNGEFLAVPLLLGKDALLRVTKLLHLFALGGVGLHRSRLVAVDCPRGLSRRRGLPWRALRCRRGALRVAGFGGLRRPGSGCLALRFKVNSFADVCEVKAPLGRRRRDCWRRSGLGLFDFQRALGTSCHFVLLA
jgi:hypothetical protein